MMTRKPKKTRAGEYHQTRTIAERIVDGATGLALIVIGLAFYLLTTPAERPSRPDLVIVIPHGPAPSREIHAAHPHLETANEVFSINESDRVTELPNSVTPRN